MDEYTADPLFNGKLRLLQPRTGYRHTIDPLLLTSQLSPPPGARVLDVGCGSGIIPLILGFSHPDTSVIGIEIQPQLADLAKMNIRKNQMEDRISIINMDISDLTPDRLGGRVDLIISNPPYKAAGTGRLNPNPQKAIARHEIKLNIHTLFAKADSLLAPRGRIVIIFPAERLFDINTAISPTALSPEWIRFIHTTKEKNAKRVIFSGVKDIKPSCRVLPPLHLDTLDKNSFFFQSPLINP